MTTVKKLPLLAVLCGVLYAGSGCNRQHNFNTLANKVGRSTMVEQYPKVPQEELMQDVAGNNVYNTLKVRYTQSLARIKDQVTQDQAKLVVIVMTPDVGKFTTKANTAGIPYIVQTCANLGIECVDFTPDILEWMEADSKNAPVEDNWTREGATFMVGQLAGIIAKFEDYHSPKAYSGKKPGTFGDLLTKDDEVMDGEKNIPYRLTANAQGLRMDHNITFPKRKQTILFLGDSKIFNPYLDNEFIITQQLQGKYPDKEIVNAGYMHYTMEDYCSLYEEKARYVEPDIVIVCTNGDDILDNYFSQRNRYSRVPKCYKPTPDEKKVYELINK